MEQQIENQFTQWLRHALSGCCLEPQSDCEAELLADDRRSEIPVIAMHETEIRAKTSDILVSAARTQRVDGDENVVHPCRLRADLEVRVRTAALGDGKDCDWEQASPIHVGRVDAVFKSLHQEAEQEALQFMESVAGDGPQIYAYCFQGSDTFTDPDRKGRVWTGLWFADFAVGSLYG